MPSKLESFLTGCGAGLILAIIGFVLGHCADLLATAITGVCTLP